MWLVLGLYNFVMYEAPLGTKNYIYLGLFILYFVTFWFQRNKLFLEITDEKIIRNGLARREMPLSEFIELQHNAGGIRILGDQEAIFVNTRMMSAQSIMDLKAYLEPYHRESNSTEELEQNV